MKECYSINIEKQLNKGLKVDKLGGTILLVLTFLIFNFIPREVMAQCSCSASDYASINVSGWIVGQSGTITGCQWGGERSTVFNTVAGAVYRISTCGASYDTQLSIYTTGCSYIAYNDDNGPACSGVAASVQFTSPGGNLYSVMNRYFCTTQSTCVTVSITLVSLPVAYNPCSSIPNISGCGVSVSGSNSAAAGAWNSYGGPFGVPGQEKLWTFTPPTSGSHTINVTSLSGGYYIDFFYKTASIGCNATGWTYIDDFNTTGASVSFTLTAGVQYYIMFDDEDQIASSVTFNITCPVYNPCASIPTLACATSTTATFASGSGAGWSPGSCGFTTGGQEKVFLFTATNTGTYTLNQTSSSGFVDYFYKATSGGCSSTGWTCIDDLSGAVSASFSLTGGTQYYILADPEFTGGGSSTFSITCPGPPSNDLVCSATSISCGQTLAGTTVLATNSGTGENQTCGISQTQPGVWYVVTGNGQYMTASLCSTAWDSKISVYSGNCSSLTCIGGVDDNGPSCSGTSASFGWASTNGVTYYIKVHGFSSTSAFNLSLSCAAIAYCNQAQGTAGFPQNLTCQNAICALDSYCCSTLWDSICATAAASNPSCTSCVNLPLYRATIQSINTGAASWCAGETRTVQVTIQNTGSATWNSGGPTINVGVKWNTNGGFWTDYHVRTSTGVVSYLGTTTLNLTITASNATSGPSYGAPLSVGSNNLSFDIVAEGVCWFGSNGGGCGPGNSVLTSPTITISSPPVANAGPDVSICSGSSTTLNGSASGATSFSWSPTTGLSNPNIANPVATPTSTTTYTLTASSGSSGQISYNQSFTQGVAPTTQATAWCTFRSQLLSSYSYSSVTIRGSNNPTGITLTDPTIVLNLANALRTSTNYSGSFGGNTWNVTTGCVAGSSPCSGSVGVVLHVNNSSCSCDGANSTFYTLRPEINNDAWGGINTANCSSPSQTMEVIFTYGGGACSSTDQVVVNVATSLPTAPTSISGTTSVCPGNATALTSNGGSLGSDGLDVWYEGGCVNEAFNQGWLNQPYSTPNTTVNGVSSGILTVTSLNNDPMIDMAGLGSFNPVTYRYIQIRYRVTAGTAGNAEIFFYNGSHNYAVGGESATGALISNGQWQILNIDMHNDPQYTTGGNIVGWRYDWAANTGVTMEIDFITLADRPIIGTGTTLNITPPTGSTVYATAKKGSCSTTSCASTTVTSVDSTLPAISCPSNISVNTSAGVCNTVVNYTPPVGTDNCSGASTTRTAGLASGSAFPAGTTTVTHTVTAANGQTAACSFTVTVTDNQLPAISCPTNITQNTANGLCTQTVNYIAPTGTDNCPGASTALIGGMSSGSSFPFGVTTVTYRVTAANGSTATCNFTVTVNDGQQPTVTCQNYSVSITSGGQVVIPPSAVYSSGSDNCGTVNLVSVVPNTFTCINHGSNSVTLTVNDGHGNTNTCSATVTVNALPLDIAPVVQSSPICSGTGTNIQIANSQSGVSYQLRSNLDNSPVGSPVIGNGGTINLPTGNITIGVSTATFNYNVLGTQTNGCFRQMSTIVSVQVIANPSGGSIASSAFCSGESVTLFVNGVSNASSNEYVWTLPAGLTGSSSSSSISVSGNIAGNYTVTVTPRNVSLPAICPGTPVTGVVNVKPNPELTITNNTPTICSGLNTNIEITADVIGTSFNWTRNNTGNVSGTTAGTGSPINVTLTNLTGTPQTVTFEITSVAGGCPGEMESVNVLVLPTPTFTINNLTATLCSGGTTNIGLTPTVTGTTFDWVVISNNGVTNAVTSQSGITGPIAIVLSNSNPTTRTITLQITPYANGCPGLSSNTSVQVLPQLNIANSVTAISPVCDGEPALVTIGTPQSQVYYQARRASDNSLVASSAVGSGSITIPGTALTYAGSPHTFNIVAVSNILSTCTAVLNNQATITVLEKPVPPTSVTANGQTALTICPDATGNITLSASGGYLPSGATIKWYSPVCGALIGSGSPFIVPVPSGTTTYYVAYDNGSFECSTPCTGVTVTVEDIIPPVPVCQPATISLNSGGTATLSAGQINNGSTDNCGIQSLLINQTTFTCANIGPNTITLTVTDNSNNQATCSATVTVQDLIAPTLSCPASFALIGCTGIMPDLTQMPSIVLANSGAQFSNTQGQNNWFYGKYAAFNTNGFQQLPNWTGFVWNNPGTILDFPQLDANGGHPQIENMHWAVRRWISNYSGTANLQVQFYDRNTSCGDGAHVRIFQNTTEVWQYFNIPGGLQTFNIPLTLNAGDRIDLAIDPKFDSGCDDTHLTGIISVPNPLIVSDNCSVSSIVQSVSTGTSLTFGSNLVNLTAIDPSGNPSVCTIDVTLEDTTDPVALCQDISVTLDNSGQATVTPAMVNDMSYDNCGIASMSLNYTDFDCDSTGDQYLTLTVTDVYGNNSNCDAIVTILDETNPVALCSNITLQLDASGNGSITPAMIDNNSTDNCTISYIELDQTDFTISNVGNNTVTLTVYDNDGNQDDCTANVLVQDVTPPVAVCQNVSVNLNASGTATITPAMVNNGSNDASGIGGLALNITDFDCSDVTPVIADLFISEYIEGSSNNKCIEIYNGTGVSVNLSTYTLRVYSNGNLSPTNISLTGTIAHGQVHVICNPGAGAAFLALANQTSGSINFNGNDAVALAKSGTNIDIFGSIGQDPDPVATPTTGWSQGGNSTVNKTLVRNASVFSGNTSNTLNFPALATEWTQYPQDHISQLDYHIVNGVNLVSLTVTDNNGNTASCSAYVTVIDNVAPVAVCQNVTVQLDATGNGSTTATAVNNGSSDACGVQSLSLSQTAFTCAQVGNSNTVTLTVTDVNGNTSACVSTVTVVDSVNPVALCQNVTVQLDATGNGSTTAAAVNNGSSDACGIAGLSLSQTDFNCTNVGNSNPVTLTVTDVNNNESTCNTTVTVVDNVQPLAICQDVTVYLFETGFGFTTASDVNNGSSDACGILSMELDETTFTCNDIGNVNTVTLTVTDINGNQNTCTASVSVVDNISPMAFCVSNVTVYLDAGGNGSTNETDVNQGSSDACGIQSIVLSQTDFNCSEVGSNMETLFVTDINGNVSACNLNIVVVDNVSPQALCKNVTVQLDATGNVSVPTIAVDNGSDDSCGIQTLALSQSDFTCAHVGSGNTVTLTVTDNNGNANTCTATVTVEDNVAPVAVCQNVTVQLDATGNGSTTAAAVNDGSSDACGVQSLSLSQTAFTCAQVGDNMVTLTVTDVNGNNSDCTATVTVEDNVAPVAVCQDVTVQLDATGNGSTTAAAVNNGSSDACGVQSLSLSQTAFTCSNVGPNTVTLTVTDVNGNNSDCTATVTVEDNVAPVAVCQNVTVQLDATGNGSTTAALVDNGSSDACGIFSLSLNNMAFTCANVGNGNTVTLTVTDNNGNQNQCTATVTVVDGVNPVAVCQDVTVQLDATGNGSTTAAAVNDGSSDACGIFSLALNNTAFTCANVGNGNTVTLTVTDNNGNQNQCTATVTVVDGVNPVAVCQDVTVQLDATGNGSTTAAAVNDGSSDACGIFSLALNNTAFTCANVGNGNTVTLTVTDNNGNQNQCTATVTVVDGVNPVAVCQDVTVQLDATGNGSTTAAAVNDGSSDACGIFSLSLNNTAFTCANVGSGNTVTLTVTDNNGNQNQCTATVTVVDGVNPVAVCQDVTVQLDATGNGSTTTVAVNDDSSDACGIFSLSLNNTAFTCANVGSGNTVTLTVTDNNGNQNQCTATVTVVDGVNPVAVCQDVTVQLDATGNGSTTAALVDNGSSDACGIFSLSLNNTAFTCANVGNGNTVTLTVTDNNGNQNQCTATVTVVDGVNPVAVCQDVTVQLDATGNGSTTAALVDNGSSDACGIFSLSLNNMAFTCANVGNGNTVTLTVTDINGNQNQCTATVTVVDGVNPVAVCQDVTVQLDATGNGSTTAALVDNGSSDACGIFSLSLNNTAFTCANVGNGNTVTLTVTDNNGNQNQCTATVTVVDGVNPVAVCQDVTVQLDPTGNGSTTAALVDNGSNDACGIFSLQLNQTAFTCADIGTNPNVVTLTVFDNNGNSSSCSANVTVVDNVLPETLCQNVTVLLDEYGNGSTTAASVDNGSNDACGIQSIALSQTVFNCDDVGNNLVILTATDNNNNINTCSATIIVLDNVPSVVICQHVTVQLDVSGNGNTTATAVNNGSNDACGIQSLVLDQTVFSCDDVGSGNTVILTVTDVNNNTSTCSTSVTVYDHIAPVANCQNAVVQLDNSGQATLTVAQVDNGSSDACGIQSLNLSQSNFTCIHLGGNTVTLTVQDVNGNINSCSTTVTVVDAINPLAVCKDATIQLDPNGFGTVQTFQINNGSTDNCGTPLLSVDPNSFTCAQLGTNTIVLTATDAAGNTGTCSASVIVQENIPPVANCQNLTIQLDSNGSATIANDAVNNLSTDNCNVSFSTNQTSFTCVHLGTNTVVLTVSDSSGNSTTCSAVVTVQDLIPPLAVCQSATIQLNSMGSVVLSPELINNNSTDNCAVTTSSISPSNFTCSHLGSNTVTLTVGDAGGNTGTCTASVTVQDLVAPTADCQNITIQLSSLGTASITATQVNNNSSDNCAITSMSVSPLNFNCSNVGNNTVTLTVGDSSGNTGTCQATVTVQDITIPNALCQGVTVQLNSAGTASITAGQINNGSNDVCGIASATLNNSNFDCDDLGANPVILTVTDVNGNVAACSATVTVQDPILPVAICQSVTISLNSLGQANLSASSVNNGSSDNCAIAGMGVSQILFNCSHTGLNTVILTVNDASGNTSTCSAEITVLETITPTAFCQNTTVQLNSSGVATVLPSQVNNNSTDNCGVSGLSVSPDTFGCVNIGANTVTLMATDIHGNTGTCSAVVTVQDNIAPIAVCQNIEVSLSGGVASITGSQLDGGSSDNCSITSMTVFPFTFSCSQVGNNNVTLTVTDSSGLTSTCSATVTVGPIPSAVASSNSPVCINGNIELLATGGVSYQWSGPGGFASSEQNPIRTAATSAMSGIYIVTVTNSAGCNVAVSTTVTVNSLPVPTISGTLSLCQGSTISLNANGGSTYEWEGPEGFTGSGMSVNIPNATPLMSGIYFVTTTNINGCSSVGSASVTVHAPPVANVTGTSSVCTGGSIALSATGGALYNWSGPNGFTGNGSNVAVSIATLAANGIYNVTVTSSAGCTSTASHSVTVNPPPVVSAGSNSPVCVGATLNLNATGGVNYLWSGPTGFSSTLQSPSRTPVVSGTYHVTITDANGCSNTASTTVNTLALPNPIVTGATSLCEGSTISLTATGGIGFEWNGPNGYTGTGATISITNAPSAMSGVYIVTVTNAAGCTASASRTVTVHALPLATATSNSPVCSGSAINLFASGGTSYLWNGPGGYASSSQNPVRSGATSLMAGIYTVTVTSTGGCTASSSTEVMVNSCGSPLVITSVIITKNTSMTILGNGAITLNVSGGVPCIGSAYYTYSWSPATGTMNSSADNHIYSGLSSGFYTVTITDCGGNSITQTFYVANGIRGFKTAEEGSEFEAYPNPTNGQTTISFTTPLEELLKLSVFAVDGKEVETLFEGIASANTGYSFSYDMEALPSGTYYAVLRKSDGSSLQIRLMLVR
ncbi:MAG: HYR domain-containing protein [Sphingobacteriales bacterium]|nr:MAG: HYR domain-containing protein [Sphingobacteriales bacterium]